MFAMVPCLQAGTLYRVAVIRDIIAALFWAHCGCATQGNGLMQYELLMFVCLLYVVSIYSALPSPIFYPFKI